ncbi:Structural maintenance of chromosomes protein 6 [Neophaeococcomyces mojaviensis]|uniref:Structural maintenance of chromosomes protein 6 n=1 Tax=Neophaeococcomyces mojaviensis TaxID=3383035 RepID=A0ACC3A721_9EURO|nr:Structural maintenance of chromosomes protein 6 [Knufia sp. JES_112]
MSRHKRIAEFDLDGENSAVSSSPHHDLSSQVSPGRKRRRITDHSDTTPEQDHVNNTSLNSDSEDDDDNASDDSTAREAATQVLRERKRRERENGNVPRENGILDSVEVYEFMCHKHFSFELGPLINFICGKNGSGKSAILTAIILCLGGKASTTNRGGSLKRFIKEGADASRIICRLKNRGEGAFMPEEYGDIIEIERHFSRAGTSGYKIRSAGGRRIVSTKKADLEAILDHFNLQIDNPLNVLSQDMARSFITSANAADKYKFFLKGVQLEQLDQDYNLLGESLQQMHQKLERNEEDIKNLETRMNEAKAIQESAKRRAGLKDRIRDLGRQIAWKQIENQEAVLQGYVDQLVQADEKIAEAQAHVDYLDVQYQRADEDHKTTERTLEDINQSLARASAEQQELKEKRDEAKQAFNNSQSETRALKDDIGNHNKTIAETKQDIEKEEQRLLELNGGGAARRLAELEAAKNNLQQAVDDLNGHRRGKIDIDRTIQDLLKIEKDKHAEHKDHEKELAEEETRLKDLQANRDRQSSAFKNNTDRLLQLIDRETRWERKPIGPIGKYVRLTRPEWSSILERMFGGTLSAFLVFNKRDSDLLSRLKDQARCDADIFIGNAQPIVPREPDERFDTVLRVLRIEDEAIKKHLIIQHAIEQQLLISDLGEATREMYDNDRLRNVRGCFAFSPNDKRAGILLKYTASGEPAQDPVAQWPGQPRMKGDLEATIAMRRRVIEETRSQTVAARKAWQDARAEKIKAEQALKRHDRREQELKIAVQAAEDAVESIENAIKDDNVESGRLEALKESLGNTEGQKSLLEDQYKDAIIAQDGKKRELRACQQRLDAFHTECQALQAQLEAAQKAHRQADQIRAKELRNKNNAIARVEDARKDRERMEEERANYAKSLEETTAKATEFCARVNVPQDVTYEQLMTKYNRMKEQQRRYAAEVGFTLAEAAENHLKATNAYKEAKKEFDNNTEAKEMLLASLEERKDRWVRFRRHISARAQITFSYLLSARGFRGQVRMNHQSRLLELSVEPDITKRNGEGRNTRTLSGGEKSFSQICLLLAMWEAMGSPIRCLDEFDVFMDAVNRNLSVKMIIEAARDSVGRQYILISPGSKSDIPKAPDVKAEQMPEPPRRGQQTIDFQRES